jgi:hypothetical protein
MREPRWDDLSHRVRSIAPLGLIDSNGWRVKLYGITQNAHSPSEELLAIAHRLAAQSLPSPARTGERYGLAFVTVHEAALFNQIIVDWWERVNELRHRVFKADPESPTDFREITATGEAFCVWELKVIAHERDAWIEMLRSPKPVEERVESYLASRLHGVF